MTSLTTPANPLLLGCIVVCLMCTASVDARDRKGFIGRHPDLSGTYNTATLTPLQRPRAFGDNLYLTQAEAEKLAAAEAALLTDGAKDSDPDRLAPPDGGDGSEGAAGNVGGYNTFWVDRGDSAIQIDGKFRTSLITTPTNGRRPPLTARAQTVLAKRFAGFGKKNTGTAWWMPGAGPFDNHEQRPLGERCILGFGTTSGPPMLPVLYNNLKRIVQTKDHLMILVEMVHDARIIRYTDDHAPSDVRSYLGDSIGRWEGRTLVVETTNFNDTPGLYGASRDMVVTERFEKQDDGSLLYSFLVDDPATWKAPWGGEYPWPTTQDKVYEYACHEGNYALGNIMRGARRLEAEASR